MRVLELLEEIEEIVDTAAGFPLTGKIMVDSQELLEIVREIRAELPDEIQQAQWIKNERERIITEAKNQYEAVIEDAQKQADALVESNDITVRSKLRADELMKVTENTAKQLKIGTYDYIIWTVSCTASRGRWSTSAPCTLVTCSPASRKLSTTSILHWKPTGKSLRKWLTEPRSMRMNRKEDLCRIWIWGRMAS